MCYRPLTIRNNVKVGNANTALSRTVPCGCCSECQKEYKEAYYLRAYYQYLEYKDKGSNAFITLTYSNKYIPRFSDTLNGQPWEIYCFNKWNVQRFIKYIKRYLVKYLNWKVEEAKELRYMICSEYGSHTVRPHHHGILSFPKRINRQQLDDILNYSWAIAIKDDNGKYIKDENGDYVKEKLGFHSYGRKGAFITDSKAIKYVVKYSVKQVNFFGPHEYAIEQMSDQDKQLLLIPDYIDESPSNYEKIKDVLPFHFQSRNFGIYGASILTDQDLINGFIHDPISDVKDATNSDKCKVKIPLYYKKKLLFDKPKIEDNAKCGLLVHNDRYYNILPQLLENRINHIYKKYLSAFENYTTFCKTYPLSELETYNKLKITKLEIYNYIDKFVKPRLFDFVLYQSLQDYSSNNIEIDNKTNLKDLYIKLCTENSRYKDSVYNSINLTQIAPDYEENAVKVKKSVLTLDVDPLEPFAFIPLYVDVERVRFINVPIPNSERLRLQNGSFIENHPIKVRKIAASKPWHEYDRFSNFYNAVYYLSTLDKVYKSQYELFKEEQNKKQKYLKDIENFNTYGC